MREVMPVTSGTMMVLWRRTWLSVVIIFTAGLTGVIDLAKGCNMATKEVGVCLHVYLERDFLSMERIVYPKNRARRLEMYSLGPDSLRQPPPPLPELDEITKSTEKVIGTQNEVAGRHRHLLRKEGDSWRRVQRSSPDNYAIIDAYGEHGWVEGPELEDYCSRLGGVITCFESVLSDCESAFDFFRYRHLLHSLGRVHKYLCHTPNDRLKRFLPFLKVIDCAETARLNESSCHRPNVTINVWNQILRLELGPELCDSLNTQRSCLLENGYVQSNCGGELKEELYRNVSAIFLATWCKLPLPPQLLPHIGSSSCQFHPRAFSILFLVFCCILHHHYTCEAVKYLVLLLHAVILTNGSLLYPTLT